MAHDLLLGIDVGTSSVKAGLFRLDGRPVAMARAPYLVDSPRPGWSEVPPERWLDALRRCVADLGGDVRRAAGVGFSVLFPALVAMDAQGRALRPAILYNDQRSAGLWTEEEAKTALALTANRLVPGTCALSSLIWLRREEPSTFRRAAMFGHANTCVVRALTGKWAMDMTNAGLSGLVGSGDEGLYCEALLDIAGLGADRLAPLVPSCQAVGSVTREGAERTGLPEGMPVAAGTGDTAAAAFGAGLADGKSAFCVLGSSDNVATVSRQPQRDPRACNMPHCLPGRWLSVATATSTGASVEWFAKTFKVGQASSLSSANQETVALRCPRERQEACPTDGQASTLSQERRAGFTPPSGNPGETSGDGGVNPALRLLSQKGIAHGTADHAEKTLGGPGGTGRMPVLPASPAALVEQAARRSPPGARGTMFLPYLQGERTPVWDPLARGAFVGMTVSTTFDDMARAVLEGAALAFRDILGDEPPRRLLAVGGGTAGALAMSLRAAAAGRTLHVLRFPETAALGAAMLAGLACGAYRSPRHALASTKGMRAADPVAPDRGLRAFYGGLYGRYRGLYPAMRGVFHRGKA